MSADDVALAWRASVFKHGFMQTEASKKLCVHVLSEPTDRRVRQELFRHRAEEVGSIDLRRVVFPQ